MFRPTADKSSMCRQSMATKCTAPSRDTFAAAPSACARKAPEGLVRHLARGHRKLAVATSRVGVAVNWHIVGRVQESGVDLSAVPHDGLQKLKIATVAATDAVVG